MLKNSRIKWKTCRLLSFLDTVAQERSGISNVEDFYIYDDGDNESMQTTTVEALVWESNNTEQLNSTINSLQSEGDNECSSSRKEAKQEKKQKRRSDRVFEYLRERNEPQQSILKNIANHEYELGSFTTHMKEVLKQLPPLLQIRARQELFQVLIKYEMMAFETPSPLMKNE